jgi:hypothetical protein
VDVGNDEECPFFGGVDRLVEVLCMAADFYVESGVRAGCKFGNEKLEMFFTECVAAAKWKRVTPVSEDELSAARRSAIAVAEKGVYAFGERAVFVLEENGGLDLRGKRTGSGARGAVEFDGVVREAGIRHCLGCFFDRLEVDGVAAFVQIASGEGKFDFGGGVGGVEAVCLIAVAVVERWMQIKHALAAIDADPDSRHAGTFNQHGNAQVVTCGRRPVNCECDGARSRGEIGLGRICGFSQHGGVIGVPVFGGHTAAGDEVDLPGWIAGRKVTGGAIEVADLEHRRDSGVLRGGTAVRERGADEHEEYAETAGRQADSGPICNHVHISPRRLCVALIRARILFASPTNCSACCLEWKDRLPGLQWAQSFLRDVGSHAAILIGEACEDIYGSGTLTSG